MGTRAIIAAWTNKKAGEWHGQYHHWDGYPEGLGKTLYDMFHKKPIEGRLKVLLEHTWSTINGKSWDLPIGYNEKRRCFAIVKGKPCQISYLDHDGDTGHEYTDGPNCYCHGDRNEEASDLLTQNADDSSGAEWAYVIDPKKRTMTIFEGYPPWKHRSVVELDEAEPDWKSLDT